MDNLVNWPTGKYATIVIDPPWPMKFINRRVRPGQKEMPYKTMPIEQIKTLPVAQNALDDCYLLCWTTQTFLFSAIECLSEWGAAYRYLMVWHKSRGPIVFNHPYGNCEFIAVGTFGKPKLIAQTGLFMCFDAEAGEHSVKPAAFYNMIARCFPAPRLDIFSRRLIPGFDVWGDEAPTETLENSQFPLFDDKCSSMDD